METAERIDFAAYKDQMVDLTRRVVVDGVTTEETVQGRVIDGNEIGLIFKKRSQRGQDLIEAVDVVRIEKVQTARLQSIGQKHLKPVSPGSVRRHLVDFHGMKRSEVEGLGLEAAMQFHAEIDHSDLGHDHDAESRGSAIHEGDPEKDQILSRISDLRRSA